MVAFSTPKAQTRLPHLHRWLSAQEHFGVGVFGAPPLGSREHCVVAVTGTQQSLHRANGVQQPQGLGGVGQLHKQAQREQSGVGGSAQRREGFARKQEI